MCREMMTDFKKSREIIKSYYRQSQFRIINRIFFLREAIWWILLSLFIIVSETVITPFKTKLRGNLFSVLLKPENSENTVHV